jgi:hypothetical protein
MDVRKGMWISGLVAALLIGGCGGSTPQAAPEAPVEAADLDETIRRCREARERLDDETCTEARRAYRARFMGDGKANYAPED